MCHQPSEWGLIYPSDLMGYDHNSHAINKFWPKKVPTLWHDANLYRPGRKVGLLSKRPIRVDPQSENNISDRLTDPS